MHPYGPEEAKCSDYEQRPTIEAITQAINLTDEVEELIHVGQSRIGFVALKNPDFGPFLPGGTFKAFIDDDGLRFQLPCCQWNDEHQHIDIFSPEDWNRPYRAHRIPSIRNIRVELQGSTRWSNSANPLRDLMRTMDAIREGIGYTSTPLHDHRSTQSFGRLPRWPVGHSSSRRPRYYALDGHIPVPCCDIHDIEAWGRWFEQADRLVGSNVVRGIWVSTIFLGIDHNFAGEGDPILFQTTASNEELEISEWRYSTWEQAARGHQTIVNGIWEGLSIDEAAQRLESQA